MVRRVPILVAVALASIACTVQAAPDDGTATVRSVIDGDTIVVDYGPHRETIRLLGIDTPETVHPTRPVECWGPEASRRLKALLPVGTTVRLQRDIEARDRYGRLLAFVVRDDGLDVQGTLVDEGAADVLSIDPNRVRRSELLRRRNVARADGRGLWGACGGGHVPAPSPGAGTDASTGG